MISKPGVRLAQMRTLAMWRIMAFESISQERLIRKKGCQWSSKSMVLMRQVYARERMWHLP